ncbi:LysR family transcriptional regulator [Mycolicibacterium pyrenivorans]|uniref:LysR family transcriptional regulator n=1 Tax=Mycolicibacterium pyrenivorans TaxID=187102 RepID=UPI0021F2EA1A|nr:LysR family transcriptional regulator [Mycolicibacterium pyrenivorans]MCV7150224.1 LysR family transcriptional regulator [Mycolicibacterium pyrenivorans]
MDTHRLKYFLRVAEEGSISQAAKVLGIAQPALSRQVQLLEEDLGVALFRRTRRGVEITEAGERLRSATAAPLRQLELAVQHVGSPLARLERGIRLGIPESAAGVLAAPLIGGLQTVFPRVNLSVAVGSTDVLVEAMLKGAVDVALINPVPDDRVFYRGLLSEELVVMGGPHTDLDPSREVAFAEFVEMPLVIPRSPTGIGHALENAALRTKVTIQYHTATDSLQVTKSLIEAGLAYAALPLSACVREVDDDRIRYAPLSGPALTQHLGVAATAQLDLPREFTAKVGETLRGETSRLIESGRWPARLLTREPWDPNTA